MRKGFALVVVFLGLAIAALVWLPGREPTHAGRPLSYWVMRLQPPAPFHFEDPFYNRTDALRALEHFGSNAIPYLISWVECEPSSWRVRVCKWTNKTFGTHFLEDYQRRGNAAALAFQCVGPVDEKTKQQLLKLVYSPTAAVAQRAAAALVPISGENPLQQNIALLKVADPFGQTLALAAFRRMGEEGRPAIPLLIDCLQHKNPAVARETAELLRSKYSTEPRVVVALLQWEQRLHVQSRSNRTSRVAR